MLAISPARTIGRLSLGWGRLSGSTTGNRGWVARAHLRTFSSSDKETSNVPRGTSGSTPSAQPAPPLPSVDKLAPQIPAISFLLLSPRRLNNPTFKYTSVSPELVRVLERFPAERLARLLVEAREDHANILATFRIAATLDQTERNAFLTSQDAAQEQARELQEAAPVVWKLEDLIAALSEPSTLPAKMMTVSRLTEPDPMAFRAQVRRLYGLTRTAEEAAEVASWLIRVTENEPNLSTLLYEAIQGSIQDLPRLDPRPPSDAYVALFAAHAKRILKVFQPNRNPLVLLLEVFTRLYIHDQQRLDPVSQSPPAEALAEVDRLRIQFLEAVRKIHRAMQAVGRSISTRRSTGSLICAYTHARSSSDVQAVWMAARSIGGTGVDRQAVANYFDGCGFNGALPEALAAWDRLQAEEFTMQENTHAAYHECLTRCGAWTDLVAAFKDQHAGHLADPVSTAAVSASMLTGTIKLANRLVKQPRHRSLHPVDLRAFQKLCAELEALVSEDVWAETLRLLKSKERYAPASIELLTPQR